MAESCKRAKLSSSLVQCEHCSEMLTIKTYRRHRKLYFNLEKGEWITTEMLSCQHPGPPSAGLKVLDIPSVRILEINFVYLEMNATDDDPPEMPLNCDSYLFPIVQNEIEDSFGNQNETSDSRYINKHCAPLPSSKVKLIMCIRNVGYSPGEACLDVFLACKVCKLTFLALLSIPQCKTFPPFQNSEVKRNCGRSLTLKKPIFLFQAVHLHLFHSNRICHLVTL